MMEDKRSQCKTKYKKKDYAGLSVIFFSWIIAPLKNIYTCNYELTIMYYNQKERISED